jgi:hypothetical protein
MNHFDWKAFLMINLFNVKQIIGIDRLILLLPALLVLWLAGCAHTATLKESAGAEITFQISFGSSPQQSTIDYYIVYSTTTFDLNTNANNNYFFIPGKSYDQTSLDTASGSKGLNYFYSNFFQYWDGVIDLQTNNIQMTKGPFLDENAHYAYSSTNLSVSNYTVDGSTLSVTIPISSLGVSGNNLYFSIVTSEGYDINNTLDVVPDTQFIELISNRPALNGENVGSTFTPGNPAGEIKSWLITVQ